MKTSLSDTFYKHTWGLQLTMPIYRNLVKESSLIPTPKVLEKNDRDVQSVVLFPAVWDDEEGPTVISFCLSPGMLPLS